MSGRFLGPSSYKFWGKEIGVKTGRYATLHKIRGFISFLSMAFGGTMVGAGERSYIKGCGIKLDITVAGAM